MAQSSEFGAVLKDIRRALSLSQAALAGRLGSTQRHVSFLETGRSQPTVSFLARICRELKLSTAQRANLYQTSGAGNPYQRRDLSSLEVVAALDLMEARVLRNWPFPAVVLDPSWDILRSNDPFRMMFAPFLPDDNSPPNLLSIMLSGPFRALITNWNEAVAVLYFRLQAAAAENAKVAGIFDRARGDGLFGDLPDLLLTQADIPIFVPIKFGLPDGVTLEMTSLLGRLVSVQDALVEGFEIELMVPTSEQSETTLRQALR